MEIWIPIEGFEQYYAISNMGNVKSLRRNKVMALNTHPKGYKYISLRKNKTLHTRKVHRLVATAFLGSSDLQVDHINGLKSDNRVENLQWVDNRENALRRQERKGTTSGLRGVCWNGKRWQASIYLNGKAINLGVYDDKFLASDAYQQALRRL